MDFVKHELDDKVVPIMFRPNVSSRHETPAERRDRFVRHIPNYARAGVRYVLAGAGFFAPPIYDLQNAGMQPVQLASGHSVTLHSVTARDAMTAISVLIGTYGNADGRLLAELCQGDHCQTGAADLSTAANNAPLTIELSNPGSVATGTFSLTLTKQGGTNPVALWSKQPAPTEKARAEGLPEVSGVLPVVTAAYVSSPKLVLQTPTTAVFEVGGTRPYASAPGCRIEMQTHERMTAECDRPSKLARLEVFMRGWTARVNDVATELMPIEDTFQTIDLPAGHSVVAFAYDPPGVRPALWIAFTTLAILVATITVSLPWRRSRRGG